MRHHSAEKWEAELRLIFDRIDDFLEDKYGGRYALHPARPARGATANSEQDGLFYVGAAFSASPGSALGPGYVITLKPVTLEKIPAPVIEEMERAMISILEEELPRRFPGRNLRVGRDGHLLKIHGDLGLGDA